MSAARRRRSWRRALERRLRGAICPESGLDERELEEHVQRIADKVADASQRRREAALGRALRRRRVRELNALWELAA